MYTVYALYFLNGTVYVGMTDNFERRLSEHKRGKTQSTRQKEILSVKIIEYCDDRLTARKREKYWKSGCGKEQLKYRGVEQSGSSPGS
ncbi:MAG: GIY-YIG nuclease family protein [Candidatus Moraniibacteriota bacterium]|nr:MAG: GIY-YIG nuclease family protein [Candidatus Moranbacteria bacterium]